MQQEKSYLEKLFCFYLLLLFFFSGVQKWAETKSYIKSVLIIQHAEFDYSYMSLTLYAA